jgi:hypothetical protein
MRAAAFALAILLAGCAGYQKTTIAVPRASLALAYADGLADYKVARYLVGILCESERIGAAECAVLKTFDARAADLDKRARALLTATEPDAADLDAVLAAARVLAPTLLGLAGVRVPVLPVVPR